LCNRISERLIKLNGSETSKEVDHQHVSTANEQRSHVACKHLDVIGDKLRGVDNFLVSSLEKLSKDTDIKVPLNTEMTVDEQVILLSFCCWM
jgi:hypothetical protein